VSGQNKNIDLQSWLTMLKDMFGQNLFNWNLTTFIVDDANAEINAIKSVEFIVTSI
jgi:hypothetical protein